MCCQLSSTKADAQSVINWAVVGQVSWQYLRAPTLECCSLSQRSSSSVYSTIKSRGFISDSGYLFFSLHASRRRTSSLFFTRFPPLSCCCIQVVDTSRAFYLAQQKLIPRYRIKLVSGHCCTFLKIKRKSSHLAKRTKQAKNILSSQQIWTGAYVFFF